MDTLIQAYEYATSPSSDFWGAVGTHLQLSFVALFIAGLIGIPLGIFVSRYNLLAQLSINVMGIVRVIPSLALLFLLIPILHTGFVPSATALTVLAIPPLLINTEAGMRGVSKPVIEAGRGMGMTYWQLLWKVQLPLALPVILAGVRIATVEVIASATLASIIGGGGLGDFITAGLARGRNSILLVGAIPVAIIALLAEVGLSYLQRMVVRRQHGV
ncbi:MAG: ABC transporter permease [Chloroflexota bacterium]